MYEVDLFSIDIAINLVLLCFINDTCSTLPIYKLKLAIEHITQCCNYSKRFQEIDQFQTDNIIYIQFIYKYCLFFLGQNVIIKTIEYNKL